MARYTCSCTLSVSLDVLAKNLVDVLKVCNFEIIYQGPDYLMGREHPGKVSFSQLVTVEALIDKTQATEEQVGVKFVVKNEELPLQQQNHCKQMFEHLREEIANSNSWRLLEVAG
ncbi:MAG: hypothetical protein F6K24_51115 [Okeania sp. SIO2D1]|nr:hypothetical protein [Okeania sp. SIO2D1]